MQAPLTFFYVVNHIRHNDCLWCEDEKKISDPGLTLERVNLKVKDTKIFLHFFMEDTHIWHSYGVKVILSNTKWY